MPASADWNFGTGDFTIDMWVYLESGPSYQHFFAVNTQSTFALKYATGDNLLYLYANGLMIGYTIDLEDSAWHHLALVKSNGTLYLFNNGTLLTTASNSTNFVNSDSLTAIIGTGWSNEYYKGYIDEFRISHVARWIESFTPPYKAYQDSTPALLTGGGYTITGSGTIENGLIDSTDQWEGSTYINTLGTVLEGTLTKNVKFPAGHVIQIRYNDSSTAYAVTNTTPPGDVVLSHSITPMFNNSKILIQIQLSYSKYDSYTGYVRLYRGSTWVYPNTSDRGFPLRGQSAWGLDIGAIQFLDSPATTSAVTYNVYGYTSSSGAPLAINRNYNASQDSYSGGITSSSISLMEIAQ